jgi:hypothetical protein
MPEKQSSFNGDLDFVFDILFVLKLYVLVKTLLRPYNFSVL